MNPRIRLLLFLAVILALVVLMVAWGIGLQEEDWGPARIRALAEQLVDRAWLPWAVFAAFVLGLQIAVPQMLLVPAAVIVLGPWVGFLVAYLGTVAGAMVGYGIGRYLGRRPVRRLSGPAMKRLSRSIARRGIVSMAVINMLPIASRSPPTCCSSWAGFRRPSRHLGLMLAVFLAALGLWYLTRRAWNWLYGP